MAQRIKSVPLPEPQLDIIGNFPGWEKATALLKKAILENGFKTVADIGGGANPLLDGEFIREQDIDYTLLDISQVELDKAPDYYRKVRVNMMASPDEFRVNAGENRFDLIFSHMFLEHVSNPRLTHGNIHTALKPGGLAIHFYPTPTNLPLAVNWLLPEWLTSALVSVAQPTRDRKGNQVKFPAFYAMCGPPTKALHAKFRELGFDVIQHTGYIGHEYYIRFPIVRDIEQSLRPVLLKARIPLTSDALLILQKQLP
jgi:SAM-dependent methyltransferase